MIGRNLMMVGIIIFIIGVVIRALNSRWRGGIFGGGFFASKSIGVSFISYIIMAIGIAIIVYVGRKNGQF